jgi:alpha-1,2-rhamnosyltransferase
VRRAKQRGATVGFLLYDLIPLSHPEFYGPEFVAIFRRWLDSLADLADFFVAISETTSDHACDYLNATRPDRDWHRVPFETFRLGCTLDLAARGEPVRDEVKAVFGGDSAAPYLIVGTIEPRKNHHLILDAFEHVWRTAPQVRLCIVGKVGWLCNDVLRRIHRHPGLGTSLLLFHDLTDAELQYCYGHARALVFASQIEGFGLPIVEGLRHRLRVMASDIPIHREVGKDFCAYFDVWDPGALARLVLDLEVANRFPRVRRPEEFELPDWGASTGEFLQRCLAAAQGTCQRANGRADEVRGCPVAVGIEPQPREGSP